MNRQRLEAEAIRDAVLAVSGKLDLTMGGPGPSTSASRTTTRRVYEYAALRPGRPAPYRRSVYRFVVRSVPDPFMETLDCADPSQLDAGRNKTLTALQALALLNDPFMVRQCRAPRRPGRGRRADAGAADRRRLPPGPRPAADAKAEREALADYAGKHGLANACRVILFNTNEFVFVD